MNGILPLWKERGMTSHDCVFKLRKLFQTKKVGHTGTLDPDVDGVLPICIGSATKMVEFLLNSNKSYEGEITIGFSTTTEDASGEIVKSAPVVEKIDESEVDNIMASFIGTLQQIPPMYSTVKVNGKKLYEYARANEVVERPVRTVNIVSFERISEIHYHDNQTASWQFRVVCSKGTYVRTLAVDLGEKLNFPAHMSKLTRIQSAGFVSEQCLTIAQLEAMTIEQRCHCLMPIENAIVDFSTIAITEEMFEKVKNGAVLPQINLISYPVFLSYENKIVALYDKHPALDGMMKPKKMLLGNLDESL